MFIACCVKNVSLQCRLDLRQILHFKFKYCSSNKQSASHQALAKIISVDSLTPPSTFAFLPIAIMSFIYRNYV